MAGITVHRAQRQDARALLDDALRVAGGDGPPAKVEGYRDWLTTPSETLRVICGQAGEDYERWLGHRVPVLRSRWNRHPAPG